MLCCKAVDAMNVQGSQETLQSSTSTSTKHSLTECSTQTCFHMTSVGGTCLTQERACNKYSINAYVKNKCAIVHRAQRKENIHICV